MPHDKIFSGQPGRLRRHPNFRQAGISSLARELLLRWVEIDTDMKFNIEVGQTERHVVEFTFGQLTGDLRICVDDKLVVQNQRLINEPVREIYDLLVGDREKVAVRIEKRRKPLFGHHRRVWVDNRLAQVA